QKMHALLIPHGFEMTENIDDANLIVYNTCHIREKAAEKAYSEVAKLKSRKASKEDDLCIVLAGCTAQAEGEEVFRRAPYVDIVIGPQSYHNLPKLIERAKREKKWVIDLDFNENDKFDALQDYQSIEDFSAFLSIQEGCDKFCHFCVVPYTRGAEYSRPVNEVYREAINLVSKGAKEITLLGQNVSAYHGKIDSSSNEDWSIAKLIRHLVKINGLERIRYTTSHPRDMEDPLLFEIHRNESKVMPYLHLPVQTGSDKLLNLMNRKHNIEFYMSVINKFKDARPDIALSSDFIVGYPGETDEDFNKTVELVNNVGYAYCYSFKYSQRPGTPGAALPNQISEDIKSKRLAMLQDVINHNQLKFNKQFIGETLKVLFQKKGKKANQITGKSPYMQSVVVEGSEDLIGSIVDVKIKSSYQNSLHGEIQ
ncbi:MAG: tRNA (N6-isopentenyl adenosine(37)-C2)-methylthiotransferase MiaB, partial [Proteobacteria bacterium]|nr:tRNA (N6-isopentenyl adenosine(37)-C2)-methylthiotransferase MiaB [Pseudomonadota bacterium]